MQEGGTCRSCACRRGRHCRSRRALLPCSASTATCPCCLSRANACTSMLSSTLQERQQLGITCAMHSLKPGCLSPGGSGPPCFRMHSLKPGCLSPGGSSPPCFCMRAAGKPIPRLKVKHQQEYRFCCLGELLGVGDLYLERHTGHRAKGFSRSGFRCRERAYHSPHALGARPHPS